MDYISTSKAPSPNGHYSQGIIHNNLIFVSGQLGIHPETGEKITHCIQLETKRALENVESILLKAGSDKNHVLKTTVYISDISLWDEVNKVYAEFFNTHTPARAIVPTKDLHFGFHVEIEAMATTL